jgi:hypothetical protein
VSLKSFIAKQWASLVVSKIYKQHNNAIELQRALLQLLLDSANNTQFGKEHHFKDIIDYDEYKEQVPIASYEDIRPYIEKIKAGEKDILWPGLPIYFAKTSGTTSGEKYIPITKDSISHHIHAARNALFHYIHETGKTDFIDGKMIFIQGSPMLENINNIKTGRLSGIVYHHVPSYLHKNRKPSYETNCIEDWEDKVDAVVDETITEDMRLISGIPPWLVMYFEKLIEKSKQKNLASLFPNLSLLVYGGVNYQPYQRKIKLLLGKEIASIETYPASEGFIAYQDVQNKDGLLLNLDAYIFYEFIELDNYYKNKLERISLKDVELDKNYVLLITSNAGLWAYMIGDVVQFVSLKPYRIKVTGRTSQYISAFGEHVIIEEIEAVMNDAINNFHLQINEFTVAPQINPAEGLPYHEWLMEFVVFPKNIEEIATYIDTKLQEKNSYYKDLRIGNIITQAKITAVENNTFKNYLSKTGKLGGQNKIARVRNDRNFIDQLIK